MKLRVLVKLKNGVLDVQGKAVERGISELNVGGVGNVRVGRLIELDVNAANEAAARAIVDGLCQKFLVNTVIEQYEIVSVA